MEVPALVALELGSLVRHRLDSFGFELVECDGGEFDHFSLQVVPVEIGFVVLLMGLQVGEFYDASRALQI